MSRSRLDLHSNPSGIGIVACLFLCLSLSGALIAQVTPLDESEFDTERTVALSFGRFPSGIPASDLYSAFGVHIPETSEYRAVIEGFLTGVLGIRSSSFAETIPASEEGEGYTVFIDFKRPVQRAALELDILPVGPSPEVGRISALDESGNPLGSLEEPTAMNSRGQGSDFPVEFWGVGTASERGISRLRLENVVDLLRITQLRFDYVSEKPFTLFLAQVGQGTVQDRILRTTIAVTNPTELEAEASLDLFGDDGTPLEIELAGTVASHFDLRAAPFSTLQLRTRGGDLRVGYARLRSNLPLLATATFSMVRPDGTVAGEAGVEAAQPTHRMAGSAERVLEAAVSTGIAFVNPSEEESATAVVHSVSAEGELRRLGAITVPPQGHAAMFLEELLGEEDEADFSGSILLESRQPIAAVILRTSGGEVSSSLPLGSTERP